MVSCFAFAFLRGGGLICSAWSESSIVTASSGVLGLSFRTRLLFVEGCWYGGDLIFLLEDDDFSDSSSVHEHAAAEDAIVRGSGDD